MTVVGASNYLNNGRSGDRAIDHRRNVFSSSSSPGQANKDRSVTGRESNGVISRSPTHVSSYCNNSGPKTSRFWTGVRDKEKPSSQGHTGLHPTWSEPWEVNNQGEATFERIELMLLLRVGRTMKCECTDSRILTKGHATLCHKFREFCRTRIECIAPDMTHIGFRQKIHSENGFVEKTQANTHNRTIFHLPAMRG